MSADPRPKIEVIAKAKGVGHVGLPCPSFMIDDVLCAFVTFWAGLGCDVEVVPSRFDVSRREIFTFFSAEYARHGFRVLELPEESDADRAGSVRRLRARRRYGPLLISYSVTPLTSGQLAGMIRLLPGLHCALQFDPTDLERLIAHPSRERPPTHWGQTRTNVSVFLRDPFGYEIECQTTCQAPTR